MEQKTKEVENCTFEPTINKSFVIAKKSNQSIIQLPEEKQEEPKKLNKNKTREKIEYKYDFLNPGERLFYQHKLK